MVEGAYQPTDRRPIASRRWPVWQKTSVWMARRGISANAISVAGMGFGVVAGVCFAATAATDGWLRSLAFVGAALMIQCRLLANLLDGMVAIASGRASAVGELYNEVPDRVSDTATMVGAGYAISGDPLLGISAACAAMFTAYIRAMGKAAGARHEFCGPMAKQQRMALLTVAALVCGLTPTNWRPTFSFLGEGRGLVALTLLVVILGSLVTAVRRLLRVADALQRGRL